jgi:hypothetical protein
MHPTTNRIDSPVITKNAAEIMNLSTEKIIVATTIGIIIRKTWVALRARMSSVEVYGREHSTFG